MAKAAPSYTEKSPGEDMVFLNVGSIFLILAVNGKLASEFTEKVYEK